MAERRYEDEAWDREFNVSVDTKLV